jgi:hypothetical protein
MLEVSIMSFLAILLLFLVSGTTSTAAFNHVQLAMAGTGDPGASKITDADQSASQANNTPKQPKRLQKHAKETAQTETLTGIVEWEYKPLSWDCDVPNCDHFALFDDASHANYELDDARAALPFEGKRAKVTGVVNTKESVIHVLSIEAAK